MTHFGRNRSDLWPDGTWTPVPESHDLQLPHPSVLVIGDSPFAQDLWHAAAAHPGVLCGDRLLGPHEGAVAIRDERPDYALLCLSEVPAGALDRLARITVDQADPVTDCVAVIDEPDRIRAVTDGIEPVRDRLAEELVTQVTGRPPSA